jgi:predicted CXXCH cytochrome family protein
MPKSRPSKLRAVKARRRRLFWALAAAAGLAVLFASGAFAFGATQEEHDTFCASCHTQPESTFYQRSVGPTSVDLASVHTTYKTLCIDCHSGAGVTGRVAAEMMGARNAARYFTRTAVQPARLTVPIGDGNCLKCHQTVTSGRDMNNHFHAFLARWQAADQKAGTCVSCHSGHGADSSADVKFLNPQYQAVCDACHTALVQGGG